MSRNRASLFPSQPRTSRRRCRSCKNETFPIKTSGLSPATNCAFAQTTKTFAGRLSIFTTVGGTPFDAQLRAIPRPNASRVCEARSKCHLRELDPRALRSLFGAPLSRPLRERYRRALQGQATHGSVDAVVCHLGLTFVLDKEQAMR